MIIRIGRLTGIIERATAAPVIRQLFSSSPRDPRYHMLSYISHKFYQDNIKPKSHEPRAALFLNRFSRTSTIMYATNGLADVLGVTADQLNGKSFYYCIQENCLDDAVKCLESAKANDSIAYLRFWFRDPRQLDSNDHDEHMDGNSSGDDDDGGVHLDDHMDEDGSEHALTSDSSMSQLSSCAQRASTVRTSVEHDPQHLAPHHPSIDLNSRSSSGNGTDLHDGANDAIFDQPATRQSSASSISLNSPDGASRHTNLPQRFESRHVELEAVISCTSDGLVVVLRRARALVPQYALSSGVSARHSYTNGCFASPWATDPILPNIDQRTYAQPDKSGLAPRWPTVAQADTASMKGPDQEDFMNSIREVAVFAWSLVGINGSLARYGRGRPTGQSLPPQGLPIWQPDLRTSTELERHPDHGNSPQDTRQNQQPKVVGAQSLSPNFLTSLHERANGRAGGSQNALSNDRNNSIATNGAAFDPRYVGHERRPQHAAHSHDDSNRPDQLYSHSARDYDQPDASIQFNDWYLQGLDSINSSQYPATLLNGRINRPYNAPNEGVESRASPFGDTAAQYDTSYGSNPQYQKRLEYNNGNATDTQMCLNDDLSNSYHGGDRTNHQNEYHWLSQPQQGQHFMPNHIPSHGQPQCGPT